MGAALERGRVHLRAPDADGAFCGDRWEGDRRGEQLRLGRL